MFERYWFKLQIGFSLFPANVCRCRLRRLVQAFKALSWSTPLIRFPSKFKLTSSTQLLSASTFGMQFSEKSTILNLAWFFKGARLSILFLLRLSTMMFVHSARASILAMPWPGSVTVKMTSGENLLVKVLRIETLIFPPRSYFSLRSWERSLNF